MIQNLLNSGQETNNGCNEPENKPFMLGCLLFKGDDLIAFCKPKKTSLISKPHISLSSEVVIIKRPKPLDHMVQYPIPLRMHKTGISKIGHIAECIQNKVVVWGGFDDIEKVHILDADGK